MNRPCARAITCPGPIPGLEGDSPITNYSAEYNDGPNFTGVVWPRWDVDNPNRPGWWAASACGGAFLCTSYISQQDADDCANRLEAICSWTPPRQQVVSPGDPNPPLPPTLVQDPTPVYGNSAQTCLFQCPDGTVSSYTVAAGTIVALTQVEADRLAYQLACERATPAFICMSDILSRTCSEAVYSSTVSVSGSSGPFTFSVIAGSFPPGLGFVPNNNTSTAIEGTPTTPGYYSFTVRAQSGSLIKDKAYQINVLGIVNDSILTQAQVGSAYSEQLTATGGQAPYTFAIVNGALPAGLTMDAAGLISGTPTTEEFQDVTISVTDT